MKQQYYLNAQGGIKLPVSKEAVELMQKLGRPCKPNDLPNPYTKGSYEYYTYQRDDGKWCTSIIKIGADEK